MDWTLLAVGHRFPNFPGPMAEGPQLLMGDTPMLVMWFNRPTPAEAKAVGTGKWRMGILPVDQHTMFMLTHVDGLSDDWMDCPYAIGLLPPERRTHDPCLLDRGWLVTLVLADCNTGIVYGLRQATWTPSFSKLYDETMANQIANAADFTREKHEATIRETYARFPVPSQMVRAATMIEDMGLPFQKFGEPKMA